MESSESVQPVAPPRRRRGRLAPPFQIANRQLAWALAGMAVLVLLAVVTSANLREIYHVQPDFILGSCLSVASFCFAKATTRTGKDRAMDELHRVGAYKQLHLARRSSGAARERLAEYFHSQAERQDFLSGLDLYLIIFRDLEAVIADIDSVLERLPPDGREAPPVAPTVGTISPLSEGERQILVDLTRDVREALRRGERLAELVAGSPRLGSVFGVLVSDLLKADFALLELAVEPIRVSPMERKATVHGYLLAAQRRSREMEEVFAEEGVSQPEIFRILKSDVDNAVAGLARIEAAAE